MCLFTPICVYVTYPGRAKAFVAVTWRRLHEARAAPHLGMADSIWDVGGHECLRLLRAGKNERCKHSIQGFTISHGDISPVTFWFFFSFWRNQPCANGRRACWHRCGWSSKRCCQENSTNKNQMCWRQPDWTDHRRLVGNCLAWPTAAPAANYFHPSIYNFSSDFHRGRYSALDVFDH